MNIVIEPARIEQIDDMAQSLHDSWVETYTGIYPQWFIDKWTVPEFVPYWLPCFEDKRAGRLNLVALDGARVVGVGSLIPSDDGGVTTELDRTYVSTDVRRQGVGVRMMEAFRQHAVANDVSTLAAWVVRNNAKGLSFWQKCGFTFDAANPESFTNLLPNELDNIVMHHYFRSAKKPF